MNITITAGPNARADSGEPASDPTLSPMLELAKDSTLIRPKNLRKEERRLLRPPK